MDKHARCQSDKYSLFVADFLVAASTLVVSSECTGVRSTTQPSSPLVHGCADVSTVTSTSHRLVHPPQSHQSTVEGSVPSSADEIFRVFSVQECVFKRANETHSLLRTILAADHSLVALCAGQNGTLTHGCIALAA